MLTGLGNALIGMCDTMMVGHYGTTDLAAVSMANCIFFTAMVFAMGAVMAITPLVGKSFVQNEHSRVSAIFHNGLVYTLLLSLIMTVLLLLVIPFLYRIGQDPEVVRVATPYYILAVVSVLPFLLFHFEKQFLEGLGNTLVAMLITIGVNLLNILLNYFFIFGIGAIPALGATGAAIATLIARTLMPIAYLVALLRRPAWRRYLSERMPVSWREIWTITKVGLPIALQQTMEIFAFTFSFIMIGWISKEALAAHQITNQISDFTFLVSIGVGAAATIRVSHQYGLRDYYAMRMAAKASIHLALLWGTVSFVSIFALRRYIPMAFSSDPLVLPIASELLILCGIFQISDALQCVGGAMLRGITDVRWPMVIALVSYILIALPVGYLLTFPMGLGARGMWIAFIIGLTLAAILLHARFYYLTRRMQISTKKVRPHS